jgi:hypothetical protein
MKAWKKETGIRTTLCKLIINYQTPNLSAMRNPELNATILALEIQLNYYQKQLDKSIRDNEVFAKTKKVLRDLNEVSGRIEFLKKLHAAGLYRDYAPSRF